LIELDEFGEKDRIDSGVPSSLMKKEKSFFPGKPSLKGINLHKG